MAISRNVNSEMARSFASMNKGFSADDTYMAPTELRTRGKDMQTALNAAMYGTSRALGRGHTADRLYEEAQKDNTNESTTRATMALREALLKQADKEAALNQAGSRLKATEKVLKDRLRNEQSQHELEKLTLKEVEGRVKLLSQQNGDRLRKMESGQKSITLLEMRIKDLQASMGETNDTEHRASDSNLQSNRKVRELERELLDLGMSNNRLTDELDGMLEKKDALFQRAEKVKDQSLRAKQRAEVQAIALGHDLTAQSLSKEPLDMRYADTLEEYRNAQNDMQTQQELHARTKMDLEKRLASEEAANNALVVEISAKVTIETGLAADLAEELAAKDVIIAQMEDKDGLCLEMGKRLHKVEQSFVDLTNELKARNGEAGSLVKMVEDMKSASKVLNAKLAMEQASTRKLVSWTELERITANGLEEKLGKLRNNETSHALALQQEEANGDRIREKLGEVSAKVITTREALHLSLAEKDMKEERLKEIQGDLKLLTAKFAKESAVVEKLHRSLNERNRTFDNKHKAFLLASNELQGRVSEKDDVIGRLSSLMAKSDGSVNNLQQTLEDAAEKSEHQRVEQSGKINELDEMNLELDSDLRQQTQRNSRMATDLQNSEDRIKYASNRMIGNDDKASDMAQINSEELMELQLRLKRETENLKALTNAFSQDKSELSGLIAKFDGEDHMKRRLQMNLRNEKHEHDVITGELEDNKEKELDRVKRIQEYEQERERLQNHTDTKASQLEAVRSQLETNVEMLDAYKKELHDAEVKESDLFSRQTIDNSTIHQLKGEIDIQEQQHEADANSVKMKIVQLQDALVEKVETVTKLEKAVAQLRQKANSLQLRLEQTEAESAQCQTSFERMLDEEQKDVALLRQSTEELSREIMSLRQQQLSKDEEVQGIESKLNERQSENETLITEAYRKDRQASTDTVQVQRLTLKERDMLQTVNDLAEEVAELKLKARSTDHAEQNFHRTLVELSNENKLIKHQIAEKMKAERMLLLQVEAQRNHVNDSSGHPDAEKHAEEALEKLLHSQDGKGIF